MSGNVTKLETEMLISYDLLAHAIQKALNCNNIGNEPELAIEEYHVDVEAIVSYPDNIDDGMPNMCSPSPLYQKEILHQYGAVEEGTRKYKNFLISLFVIF